MTGRREGDTELAWFDFYPVAQNLIKDADDEDGATFCVDIGGGKGHDLENLHDRFPALPGRLVLQDQEEVVGASIMFDSMVHNFFQPQPIEGMHTTAFPGQSYNLNWYK